MGSREVKGRGLAGRALRLDRGGTGTQGSSPFFAARYLKGSHASVPGEGLPLTNDLLCNKPSCSLGLQKQGVGHV